MEAVILFSETDGARERFERLASGAVYACAWGYARRLTLQTGGGRHDAEDLLQDALMRAWDNLHTLRDEACFKAWLLTIIRRLHLTNCAARRPVRALDPLVALPAPDVDVHTRALLEALNSLPEESRELLSLFYLHGLSMAETAQVLGIAGGVVHMRLARARARLRHELERRGFHTTRCSSAEGGTT